ncbi:MAG TPA: phosphopantetheine-binding protein [Streptosporangiaceae bacterium]|nr:phosphopantetheine-binding protein [Streptosporangiaceae bacterium]
MTGQRDVLGELRQILAGLTGDGRPLAAGPDTPLLREGIGLDSLGGTMLLAEVQRRFGVDVADEDLNLDSLATLGTLADYIATRIRAEHTDSLTP